MPPLNNRYPFAVNSRLALSKNSANGANRANRGAGDPVLGQLSGREHVGAGSEPAPTTGKKYILPGGFPLPGQNKLRNFIEQNPAPVAAIYQPAIFYTENAVWCYQKTL
jgi:hypothetical protein